MGKAMNDNLKREYEAKSEQQMKMRITFEFLS